jgi:hypothetical protein
LSCTNVTDQPADTSIHDQDLSLQVPTASKVLMDLFFTDPVITSDQSVAMIGVDQKTISSYPLRIDFSNPLKFENGTYYLDEMFSTRQLSSNPPISNMGESYGFCYPVANPSWVPQGIPPIGTVTKHEGRRILSMCQNPLNLDIYLLIEKEDNLQFIEIVRGDSVVSSIFLDAPTHYTKIRYYDSSIDQHIYLLATNAEGQLSSIDITNNSSVCMPYPQELPPFLTWDAAGDVFIGYNSIQNQFHIYTTAIQNEQLVLNEIHTMQNELGDSLERPIIQYNPSTHCFAIWEPFLSGKAGYAVSDESLKNWKWKRLQVTPMNLFMFSTKVAQKIANGEEGTDLELWNSSEHFYYIGVKEGQSQLNLYKVYAN